VLRERKIGGGVKNVLPLLFGIAFLLLHGGAAQSEILLDVESGRVSSGYNDVSIPGDTGNRFSLTDDLSTKADLFFRGRVGYTFGQRHTISALYAPLTLNATGSVGQAIDFESERFPAGTDLKATYTFNSCRLTYRYSLHSTSRLSIGVGFTAKIRDAVVRVEGNGRAAEKSNVGFVPLANFHLSWFLSPRFELLLEGDALAAPQGRAEDVQVAGRFQLNDDVRLRAGYRIVEGGADNDTVYNFTLVNYLLAGLTLSL